MALKDEILGGIKEAMKAKDQIRLTTLRMLQSSIKNKEIEIRPKEIEDDEVLSVINKLVKQRKESIQQYQDAGRQDLADKEAQEASILEKYLPEQLSEEKVTAIVDEVIAELQAESPKQMGQVMKEVMNKTQGQADNKLISQIVKSRLSQ